MKNPFKYRVWKIIKWMIVILSLLLYAFLSKLVCFHFTSVFNDHKSKWMGACKLFMVNHLYEFLTVYF